jgi:hypothetical protein
VKPLQLFDNGLTMALSVQVDDQVLPEQTSELILSSPSREVSSFVVCPLALCTVAGDAHMGQEGIDEADRMQVCNCGLRRAVLLMAEPQQLLHVFHKLLTP